MNILSKITTSITCFFEYESNRLDLWYYISFISGIIFYFKTAVDINILFIILVVIILSILAFIFRATSIIFTFLLLFTISFNIGIYICKSRLSGLEIISLKTPIITEIEGIIELIKPTERGRQIILRITKISNNNALGIKKVRLSLVEKLFNDINVDDKILIKAKIYNLKNNILPNSYNFTFYSILSQIQASGYILNKPVIISSNSKKLMPIGNLRQYLYKRLIAKGGKINGNFIAAILLGETKALDKTVLDNMRIGGVSHILCVSGLHLSLVAMLIYSSSRFILNLSNFIAFRYNIKVIAAVCSLVISYFYLCLTGEQIAATRAFLMTFIYIIATILGRRPYLIRTLGIAAIAILLPRPEYILFPAFQLSFSAVLALITGYEWYKSQQIIIGKRQAFISRVRLYMLSNIYSSFLAGIVTGPIAINHFYIFSTYSLLNNLIAVPIMSLVLMPLGVITILLVPLNLDAYGVKILSYFIEIIINFVTYTNKLPYAILYLGNLSFYNILFFLIGFFWLAIWQSKIRWLGLGIMLVACYWMILSPKANFIYDYDNNILGVNNKGKLVIYGESLSKFTLRYWANWWGQKEASLLPLKNKYFVSKDGFSISINRSEQDCIVADVQLNIGKHCKANILEIDKKTLEMVKLVAIYCNPQKCHFEYEKNIWYNTLKLR